MTKVIEKEELKAQMGLDEDMLFDELELELEQMKADDLAPDWFTVMSWQTIRKSMLWRQGGETTPRDAYTRVAKSAAGYMPLDLQAEYEKKFFDLAWKGWLALATPVFANLGTDRGMAVSCSGNYVEDDLGSIYGNLKECAMLTKYGFGTSACFSALRSRGAGIVGTGGHSSGVVSWIRQYKQMTDVVTQGSTRRGAIAAYIDIESGDFDELLDWFRHEHDKFNVGFLFGDSFIKRCKDGDAEAIRRRKRVLDIRRLTGSGYIIYIDKANAQNPECYAKHDMTVKASNLCTEIFLHSDKDNVFTCVLSSMNALHFDTWKNTDAVQVATIFLDCVAQDLIERGENIPGLERAIHFTKRNRALGLGLLGFHSYLQSHMIGIEELDAHYKNEEIFRHLNTESLKATKRLAVLFGEPEVLKGTGLRNTHRLAVAPNMTSAMVCGSQSQGIEPWYGCYFNQDTSRGALLRINPFFIKLLKSKKKYTREVLESVRDAGGSCQHLDFLADSEKSVFKTAFEIDQMVLLRLANNRQKQICQGQSLNLFFPAIDESWGEEEITKLHQIIDDCHSWAEQSSHLKALYYMRSQASVGADKGRSILENQCVACEG